MEAALTVALAADVARVRMCQHTSRNAEMLQCSSLEQTGLQPSP